MTWMNRRHAALRCLAALGLMAGTAAVHAHGSRVGALVIDHPYALPTPGGARTGAVYFRELRNTGTQADALTGARTPAAASVEIHRSVVEGDVARMRAQTALPLAPGQSLPVRHGGTWHLMLVGLAAPLKHGDRFPMTLRFEKAGEVEVVVQVQRVKDAGGGAEHGGHHGH
jgi:copper(I)-binding protein